MLELASGRCLWMWRFSFLSTRSRKPSGSSTKTLAWLSISCSRSIATLRTSAELSYYFSRHHRLFGSAACTSGVARRSGATRELEDGATSCCRARPHNRRRRRPRRALTCYHRYRWTSCSGVSSTNHQRYGSIGRFEHASRSLGRRPGSSRRQRRIPQSRRRGLLLPLTAASRTTARRSSRVAATLVRALPSSRPRPEEAVWMLGPSVHPQPPTPPQLSAALPETGYFVSRSPSGDHLVIDGGPHGYRNGGHAHADALSLTFSVGGVPLLIDPGTGCYTTDPELRDRLRSTALHNTLTLDDRPQSVSNGPFHWSHVANTRVHAWRTDGTFDFFDGGHDGYHPAEHRRRVLSLHGTSWSRGSVSPRPAAMHACRPLAPRSARTIDSRGRRAVLAHTRHACARRPHRPQDCSNRSPPTLIRGRRIPGFRRASTTTVRVTLGKRTSGWSAFSTSTRQSGRRVDCVPVGPRQRRRPATAIRITPSVGGPVSCGTVG